MVSFLLLDTRNASNLTLTVKCMEIVVTTLVVIYRVSLCKSAEQLNCYLIAITWTIPFSHVNCGQLHCKATGNYRLSVGERVSILTRGTYVAGEGYMPCKYVWVYIIIMVNMHNCKSLHTYVAN